MIENDMCIRVEPVYETDTLIALRKECVITKEEFIECYNAWIKAGTEGDDTEVKS